VPALAEDGLDAAGVQAWLEVGALSAGHAVWWPRVDVVRGFGEVGAWIDVVVASGYHVGVPRTGGDVVVDGPGYLGAAGDGEAAALAEVILYVDDEKCPAERLLRCPRRLRRRRERNPVAHVGSS
jgi:hypothetical protein